MKTLLVVGFLLLSSNVWACESYEECIGQAKEYAERDCELQADTTCLNQPCKSPCDGSWPWADSPMVFANYQTFYLKAIAYKLNEISQKIDRSGNPLMDAIVKDQEKKR